MLTRKLAHFNHLIYPNDIINLFGGGIHFIAAAYQELD